MNADASPSFPFVDWARDVWDSAPLGERHRQVLVLRIDETLQSIGEALGVTRERVRQIETEGTRILESSLPKDLPREVGVALEGLRSIAVFSRQSIDAYGRGADSVPALIVAALYGMTTATAWGGARPGLYTFDRQRLSRALRELAGAAPVGELDVHNYLPGDRADVASILAGAHSPLEYNGLVRAWVRRGARSRDAAYRWMLGNGEAAGVQAIASALELDVRALREQLRRDRRFIQVHPSGEWTLREWSQERTDAPKSAVDAVEALLDREGPLTREEIEAALADWYPVSSWRVNQVLASDVFGWFPDGRHGLVRDGAVPKENRIPSPHRSVAISEDAQTVGFRQLVTSDVVRGSGIGVPAYLAWALGVEGMPGQRVFIGADRSVEIRVRRNTSACQLSSLRTIARTVGAVEGCVLALIFRVDLGDFRAVHGCAAADCRAPTVEV